MRPQDDPSSANKTAGSAGRSAGSPADGGLGDALDVVAKDLAVALRAALAKTLASFAATRHDLVSLGGID